MLPQIRQIHKLNRESHSEQCASAVELGGGIYDVPDGVGFVEERAIWEYRQTGHLG